MNHRRVVVGLVVFLLSVGAATAAEPNDPLAGFDEYVQAVLADFQIPGLCAFYESCGFERVRTVTCATSRKNFASRVQEMTARRDFK